MRISDWRSDVCSSDLEILDTAGSWLPVSPPPGAMTVNVGDMLQRLTNDLLPSTTHRVRNPDAGRAGVARYSMPFFLHFRSDYVIRTLESCIDAAPPYLYPEPITAHVYLQERLRETGLKAWREEGGAPGQGRVGAE